MKKSAYLINTSRGPIVDEAALIAALRDKRIAGAGLDVFDIEPLPIEHPLRKLDNVVITPHLGYVAEQNYRAYFAGMVEDIRAFLDGKPVRVLTTFRFGALVTVADFEGKDRRRHCQRDDARPDQRTVRRSPDHRSAKAGHRVRTTIVPGNEMARVSRSRMIFMVCGTQHKVVSTAPVAPMASTSHGAIIPFLFQPMPQAPMRHRRVAPRISFNFTDWFMWAG